MERSFLTKEEYGAVHEEPFPEGSELSKEEVEAKWSDRYMRLKLSSARQLSEMAEQVAVLTAKVAYLEMLCDRHGIAPGDEDSSSLEAGLALLTGGVMPPVRRDEVQANAAVALTLPSGPAATLSGLHSGQNVISVAIAGRLVELEEMPVLLLSGGADKRVVASQFDTASHSVTISGAVALPAPVLDISVRPNLTDSDVDGVLAAVALMDGSVALISAAVDLAAPIPVTARPPVNVAVHCLQKDHTKFVTRVKWSSSGAMLATACQDGGVSIYAVEVGAALRKLTTITFPGAVEAVEFVSIPAGPLPAGEYVAASVRGAPVLFYINAESFSVSQVGISEDSGAPLVNGGTVGHSSFTKVGFTLLDLVLSPCGMKLAASTDHGFHFVYSVGTSNIVKRLCGHNVNDMSSVRGSWHPSGAYFCSTSDRDNCVYVWEVEAERVVGKICQHSNRVRSVTCWHDSRAVSHAILASCSFDKTIQLWPLNWE